MVALGHFHAWAVHGMPMVAHAEAHSFLPYMGGKRRRGGTGEEAPGGAPGGRGEEAGGGTKTKGWGGRVFRTCGSTHTLWAPQLGCGFDNISWLGF